MSAQITTSHGVYTGRTIASIVRRVYGRTAFLRWSPDGNSPHVGEIVRPLSARHRRMGLSGLHVEAIVRSMDGPEGKGLYGPGVEDALALLSGVGPWV